MLATPLTVCLVVLGKYVPLLEFFPVLMGDDPAMAADVHYYQRLLADDQDEAVDVVETYLGAHEHERLYDDVLVPALSHARRDRARGTISGEDEQVVARATREIVEDVGRPPRTERDAGSPGRTVRVLGVPVRDLVDETAFVMFGQLLDPSLWALELASAQMLTAEVVSMAAQTEPVVICVGCITPGGLAHTRYLVKRLRARFAAVTIVVGRWGGPAASPDDHAAIALAGAEQVTTSLIETRERLLQLRPVLLGFSASATAA